MGPTRESLLHPPFQSDPPIKLNISAKVLGLIYAVLAGIASVLTILQFPSFFRVGGLVPVVIIAEATSVVGMAMITLGGYQMYRTNKRGKEIAIEGMTLYVFSQVVAVLGQLLFISYPIVFLVSGLVFFAVALVFYYLAVISHFPEEAHANPEVGDR
jgi:hypothetical protein